MKPPAAKTDTRKVQAIRSLLAQGVHSHQQGALAQAEALYRQVLLHDPQNADALHLLGLIAYQEGNQTEAIRLIERAIACKPGIAVFHLNLGAILKARGELEAAITHYQEAIRLQPDLVEAYNNLGNVLHAQGRFQEAVTCYHQAIRLRPDYAEAYANLGACLRQQGKQAEAIMYCRQALQIRPDHAEAYSTLGNIFWDQGDLEAARVHFQKAVQVKPDNAEGYFSLGNLLQSQGDFAGAIASYRQALHHNPGYAEAYNNLGTALQKVGDLSSARTSYEQALRLQPDLAEAHKNLGDVHQESGHFLRAIAHYRKALRYKPGYAEACTNLATALQMQGKFSAALLYYRKALQIDPACLEAIAGEASIWEKRGDFARAYRTVHPWIASGTTNAALLTTAALLCRHYNGLSDQIIPLLEQVAQQETLSLWQRRNLLFALGKLYDEQKLFDKAFTCYQQANACKPCRFDPDEHMAFIKALIETYDTAFMTRMPRASLCSERLVFIVGMPRSGTSLVEQILASHPAIFGAGELPTLPQIVQALPAILGPASPYPRCLHSLSLEVLNTLAHHYLKRLPISSRDASRVTDKMPLNFLHLGLIALLFPQARIIHCLRDPLDTCLSCYFQDFAGEHPYAYNLTHLGLYYRSYQKLMQHWKEVIDLPLLEVHYEELVTHPEEISRQMVAFCGLPWDERCLRFYENKRLVKTASYDQVRRPLYTTSLGRHRPYTRYLEPLRAALAQEI